MRCLLTPISISVTNRIAAIQKAIDRRIKVSGVSGKRIAIPKNRGRKMMEQNNSANKPMTPAASSLRTIFNFSSALIIRKNKAVFSKMAIMKNKKSVTMKYSI